MGTVARTSRILAAASLAAAAVLASVGAGAAPAEPGAQSPGRPRFTAGADGAGDPYFPRAGNGGYDVSHYDLDLDYEPPTATVPPTPLAQIRGRLDGVATIDLVARQDLDRFNLDLRGMTVSALTIDGKRATGSRRPRTGQRSTERRTGTCRTTRTAGGSSPCNPDRSSRPVKRRGSSSPTAARPRARPTSRARSTAGSRRATAPWWSASPRGR